VREAGDARAVGGPSRPSIGVRFTYDLNGVLEVETTVVSTGKKALMVIERTPGRLTRSQVEEARKAMARLKLHPRDALPNTTALARAEALYVELAGPERSMLGEAISHFRAALEAQDPAAIDALRGRLNGAVQALRR
jgi:molecular chaperone HscC